jgi:hypothetical protein
MTLLHIGKGIIFAAVSSLIWLVGAIVSSLVYNLVTVQEWTDFGATIVGLLTLLFVLAGLGVRELMRQK